MEWVSRVIILEAAICVGGNLSADVGSGYTRLPVRRWNRSLPVPARRSTRQTRHATQPYQPRRLRSSYSLAATNLSESALGFFGVGGLPQSPVFFTKKRRIISHKQPKYWYRAATEGGDTYIEQYCSNSPVGGDANITTA